MHSKFRKTDFWNLIESSKSKTDDLDKQIKILIKTLSKHSEADIIEFENIFQELYVNSYHSDLGAAAYMVIGGCSDDGFDYFRGWLIAQGKEVYSKTLKKPEYLAKIVKIEERRLIRYEEMLSVAGDAYFKKTGVNYSEFMDMVKTIPYPNMELDWKSEGDDLKNKFPKLWKKFCADW